MVGSTATGSGSSRRFLFVILCFASANAAALWWIYSAVRTEPAEDAVSLNVESVSPRAETTPNARIEFRFSRDAIPSSAEVLPPTKGLIRIFPEVAGRTRWIDARTLVFEPAGELPLATKFRVRLAGRVGAALGLALEGEREFEFWTTPLQLEDVHQVGFSRDLRATIRFSFNDLVSPSQLSKNLKLFDAASDEVKFRVMTPKSSRSLEVRTESAVDELVAVLATGLQGTSGPLALQSDRRVPVPLTFKLRLVSASSESVFRSNPRLFLRFNQALDAGLEAEKLESFFSVTPDVEFSASVRSSDRVTLKGPFQPGKRYKVTVRQGLPGLAGSVLTEDIERDILTPGREPGLAFRHDAGYLAKSGNGRVLVESANVAKVSLGATRVPENNLVHYLTIDSRWYDEHFLGAPRVKNVEVETVPNELVETAVPVANLLEGQSGIWLLSLRQGDDDPSDRMLLALTDIGLTAKLGARDVLVWATSLEDGTALPGVEVSLLSYTNQKLGAATTDADGLARIDLPRADLPGSAKRRPDARAFDPFLILGRNATDVSFLQLSAGRRSMADFDVSGRPYRSISGYDAYVYSDRGVYRPGETLRIEAIVRDAWLEAPGSFPVELEILRPDRKRYRRELAKLGDDGVVAFEIPLSEGARTGRYSAKLRTPGDDTSIGEVSFLVDDFVADRLAVSLELPGDSDRRFESDSELDVALDARYLAGLPAAGVDAALAWEARPVVFSAEGWSDFDFGLAKDREAAKKRRKRAAGSLAKGPTDSEGRWRSTLTVPELASSTPVELRVRGDVFDTSGRAVSAFAKVEVDPSPFYIGIQSLSKGVPPVGDPVSFELVSVSGAGEIYALDQLSVQVFEREWTSVLQRASSGRYRYSSNERESKVATGQVAMRDGRGRYRIRFERPGDYRIHVKEATTGVEADLRIWVAGNAWSASPNLERPEQVEIAIEDGYLRPGATAKALIRSPFKGTLLLSLESDRVLWSKIVTMTDNNVPVEVPLPEGLSASVYLSACIVRGVKDSAANTWAPVRAYGSAPLEVDFTPQQLLVDLLAPNLMEPETKSSIGLRVTGSDGAARTARVSLYAIDEGILARTGFESPDPWFHFYGRNGLGVELSDLYGQLLPELALEATRSRAGGGDASPGSSSQSLLSPVRAKRFRSTALWLGSKRSDEDGYAFFDLQLPAFTGQIRLMAVASDRDAFGCASRPVIVRGPLNIEIGMPRFVSPGDRFEATVDVLNATDEEGTAVVAWSTDGPLSIDAPAEALAATADTGKVGLVPTATEPDASAQPLPLSPERTTVELSAKSTERLRFGMRASSQVGTARASLRSAFSTASVVETIELPVRPAAPRVHRSSSGSIDATTELARRFAADFTTGTSKQRLVLSGLPHVDLLGSLDYVVDYPHGCLEQTTSRCFPLLYLQDLSDLLSKSYTSGDSALSSIQDMKALIAVGLDRLSSMQSGSGGFATWPGSYEPWAWGSVYATHFLHEARIANYDIDSVGLDAALDYLERIAESSYRDTNLRAYASYVLALERGLDARPVVESVHVDVERALHRPASERPGFVQEARFLLGAAWLALGESETATRLIGEDLPSPSVGRELGGNLRSPARETAIVLSALLDVAPQDSRIPTLVERLRGLRVDGRWHNTQENGIALLALGKYARLRNRDRSTFTAIVKIGDREGVLMTSTDSRVFEGDFSGEELKVTVEGAGTLYWYLDESGVPSGDVEERDSGLAVRRRFLDSSGREIEMSAGTLQVKRGDVLRVELELSVSRAAANLAIVDLLPAGFEIENPRLFGAASAGSNQARTIDPRHVDIRDDRILVYLDAPKRELTKYEYSVRAVTKGEFALPVVSVEALYDPGIFSRHGAGRVVIR